MVEGKGVIPVKLWPRSFHTVKAVFSCLVSLIVLLMIVIPFVISVWSVFNGGKKISDELPLIWLVTIDSLTIDMGWASIFLIILLVLYARNWANLLFRAKPK
jgi:ABC-type Fe3+ transport system permease subunit